MAKIIRPYHNARTITYAGANTSKTPNIMIFGKQRIALAHQALAK